MASINNIAAATRGGARGTRDVAAHLARQHNWHSVAHKLRAPRNRHQWRQSAIIIISSNGAYQWRGARRAWRRAHSRCVLRTRIARGVMSARHRASRKSKLLRS